MTPNDNPFPEETEYLDEIAEGVGASEPSTPPLNPFPKGRAYLAEIAENISSATQFIGVTTTVLTDGATTNPITINGESVTAVAGNITSYGADEFIYNGSAWQLFGGETHGLPAGGTQGQFLVKNSSTDYDASWVTVPDAATTSFGGT